MSSPGWAALWASHAGTALNGAYYPAEADPIPAGSGNGWMITGTLAIRVLCVTMVCGNG